MYSSNKLKYRKHYWYWFLQTQHLYHVIYKEWKGALLKALINLSNSHLYKISAKIFFKIDHMMKNSHIFIPMHTILKSFAYFNFSTSEKDQISIVLFSSFSYEMMEMHKLLLHITNTHSTYLCNLKHVAMNEHTHTHIDK